MTLLAHLTTGPHFHGNTAVAMLILAFLLVSAAAAVTRRTQAASGPRD